MAVIQGFAGGTIIVFSSGPTFPEPPVIPAAPNDQPASEALFSFPQICGLRCEYSGPLSPDMALKVSEIHQ